MLLFPKKSINFLRNLGKSRIIKDTLYFIGYYWDTAFQHPITVIIKLRKIE